MTRRLRRSISSAPTLLSALYSFAVLAAPPDAYRVAGVIVTPQKQLVMIADSNDDQKLYRLGDSIEDFRIVEIRDEGVALQRGAVRVFLELKGLPTTLEDVTAARSVAALDTVDEHATQAVDYQFANRKLSAIFMDSDDRSSESKVTANPGTDSERIARALGLPLSLVISAVDRDDVSNKLPRETAMLLARRIANNETIRLQINGSIAGIDVLYVTPLDR